MDTANRVSINEVAFITQYDVYTLRKLARDGAIPAHKEGRDWRISVDDVRAYQRAAGRRIPYAFQKRQPRAEPGRRQRARAEGEEG